MAEHRHKRDTNARRKPRAALVAGPLALLATASAVTLGVLASSPEPTLLAQDTAADVSGATIARETVSRSGSRVEAEKLRLMDAPLVIAVVSFTRPHPKVPPWEQELSAGASAMNIVNAATALGYGANWLTGWFAFDRDVLDGLGLKPDEKLAGFIHVGTPTKPNEDRPRPVLSEIVSRF